MFYVSKTKVNTFTIMSFQIQIKVGTVQILGYPLSGMTGLSGLSGYFGYSLAILLRER